MSSPEERSPSKEGKLIRNSLPALMAVALISAAALLLVGLQGMEDEGDGNEEGPSQASLADRPVALPFTDVANVAGILFTHINGAQGEKLLPETGGSGCAWLDYDQDGDPDLLLLNGRPWPWDNETPPPSGGAISLFRNDGGEFVDVTADVGLVADFYGQGVAVGDIDSDGDDDLFFTSLGRNYVYRNNGGRFVEVANEVNLAGSDEDWTTSAGFFDYDQDGDLDLFVGNYLHWTRELDDSADFRLEGAGRSYAHPSNFPGADNYLYRNDCGQFVDVSQEAGIKIIDEATGQPLGKALAITFVDFDGDGWLDVCVANDTVRHFLYRNNGDGTFDEVGEETGFAFNAAGQTTSGMGVDAVAIDDGRLAIAIGNFADEMTSLYVVSPAEGAAMFDESVNLGVGGPTRSSLTFGLLFDDFDLDGRSDLVHVNGHLEETISAKQADQQYAQSAQFFWNAGADQEHQFIELSAAAVQDLAKPVVGRGVASADFDLDGDVDLVVTQVNGPPLALRNDQSTGNHWLRCRLEGAQGNPHAIGATVELRTGGGTHRRVIMPTRSYLSQCEPVAAFGLGDAEAIESLTVIWPDGVRQEVAVENVDQTVVIRRESDQFLELANRGQAELENGQFSAAIELFNLAIASRPTSLAVQRNLVRALIMNGQQEEALAQLARIETLLTQPSPDVAYMRGLAQLKLEQYEDAAASFDEAVRLDPNEATFYYQWALALIQLNEADQARQKLERTVQLDPLHASAHYQLSTMARKAGDQGTAIEYLRNHQRIIALKGSTPAAALEACRYTVPEPPEPTVLACPPSVGPSVEFVAVDPPGDGPVKLAAAAPLVLEDSGRYQLAAVTTEGDLLILGLNDNGVADVISRFEDVATGAVAGGPVRLLVGNALVDPMVDGVDEGDQPELAVVSPEQTRLLRYSPVRGVVDDLTEGSGIAAAAGHAAQWIDAEHDGDIDLCIATADGLRIWRNNGDGTFVDATEDFGVESSLPAVDLDAADFDGTNLGAEIVLCGPDGSVMWRNELAGQYALDSNAAATWPACERVELDDFDNDGRPDAVFLDHDGLTLILTGKAESQRISVPVEFLHAVTTIDADNDGWLDLAVVGRRDEQTTALLIRNRRGRLSSEIQELATIESEGVHTALGLDADGDCDTDLLFIRQDGRLQLLRNDTVTTNRQLKLTLHSFAGHPSSIGVRVQVRSEDHVVTRWTDRELPIEIGVADKSVADAVQTLWVNGVFRNEVAVPISCEPLHVIIIEFLRTDSCPFLYAQQGGQWRFLTDLLGAAPLNVVVARNVPMSPDPDELYVLGPAEEFAEGQVAARMRITSELREVIYIDELRLLAVDHPEDATVFSRDRVAMSGMDGIQMRIGHDPIPLRSAVGSDGVDRTETLNARDGLFAAPGRVLPPPSVGYTEPLSLELDFGSIEPTEDLLLALTGWFRFGNASTNIAASQRGDLKVVWPTLEAEDAGGKWTVVDEMVGFPAGNTKTIVCDLQGKLPDGTRRLRLTTSFEVRWDEIALYRAVDRKAVRVSELSPSSADLLWHGFHALRAPSADLPHAPILGSLSDEPPWLTAVEGWSTRYGAIDSLVAESDGRLAILNSGDGATFEFPVAGLPAIESDRRRTLLLYTRGWIKAGDPNCLPGLTVSPLPGEPQDGDSDEDDQWQTQYNTRWVPRNRFNGQPPTSN